MPEPAQSDPVSSKIEDLISKRTGDSSMTEEGIDVPARFREKKRLHWSGKTCVYSHFVQGE
jgi:tRNA-dihydrouridine synthase 3